MDAPISQLPTAKSQEPGVRSRTGRRIKLLLEYDGSDFNGWQLQSGREPGEGADQPVRTVQGVVESALKKATGADIRIAGASRTDAGVHARGQTASFLLPDELTIPTVEICQALNGNMNKDVTALSAEEMPLEFHAQRDATGKIYTYSMLSRRERPALLRRTHWHVRFALDLAAMRQAAAALVGTHDFTSFATRLKETQAIRADEGKVALETVRTIRSIDVVADPEYPGRIVLRIEGSGFLYQMVRTIAGSLVDVGRGFRPPQWMAEALAARDRRQAGPTAPAHGLCLECVKY
jgi:tRNA pseudouridine38-40 synthase